MGIIHKNGEEFETGGCVNKYDKKT